MPPAERALAAALLALKASRETRNAEADKAAA